ncbi:MAG: ATP-dependent DNA helicase [Methanolinea sp.]|nr:ATP-dependent DNA helicase [Methanolinea sp.]
MTGLEDFFPYPGFRPHQREMLEFCAACARDGGIALIDAPTGSGKSSILAALLAGGGGRRVLVAVRTVSQLNTFIREASLIRRKKRDLRVAYLVGKRGMCPLSGEGDVYRRCEGVKAFSSTLMRQRAENGALVPSRDPFIRQQIQRMDPQRPILCPFFIASRVFIRSESGLRMAPSPELRAAADRVLREDVWPRQLQDVAHPVCPYEMMVLAAQKADVILLNYQHIFDEEISRTLFANLDIDPSETILLIDEAHNCGDAVSAAQSVAIDQVILDQAGQELAGFARKKGTAAALQQVLPRISEFMDGVKNSPEAEDWFDPGIFDRMVVRGSLYRDMGAIVDDLMELSEKIHEKNMREGEFRESAIEKLTRFLFSLSGSSNDPSFLTLFQKDEGRVTLEVRCIDPGIRLSEIGRSHYACILISGTLSPVESYARLYFRDIAVKTLSLPNAFPRENRLVLCAEDITTAYSMRQNDSNLDLIEDYIREFSRLPGNIAVYFPSYQFLDHYAGRLGDRLGDKAIYVEPRDAREAGESLREFLSLPGSGRSGLLLAVCGGKWSEGLDYRGELLRAAMVIGLPLAPFNHVRKMIIEYYRRRFGEEGEFLCYTLPAVNRAQQALGRVLRTPEDRGVLVFGEKRFLDARVNRGLSPWIREELHPCLFSDFKKVVRSWR